MKARVSNLNKTAAEWARSDFIPLAGELVIYASDDTIKYARIKVGDGVHTLSELPFIIESVAEVILTNFQKSEVSDAGRITEYLK